MTADSHARGDATVTAAVLIIGNEILSGRTQDANLGYLARALNGRGIRLREARVVADVEEAIVEAVQALAGRYDHVFTTGGIGPTHDDITADSIARAFGVPVEQHPEATRRLEAHYGDDLTEARLRMARIPRGADLVDNPVSRAPGFRIGNVYVLPGVPRIMQAMVDGLLPSLTGGRPMLSETVICICPESRFADALRTIQAAHAGVEIGSYPFMKLDRPGTSVVLRGIERAEVEAAVAAVLVAAELAGIQAQRDPPA